jgi:hypothetical protein
VYDYLSVICSTSSNSVSQEIGKYKVLLNNNYSEIGNNKDDIKKNINDKIYWKNLDDGNYIYSIQLDEGFYSIDLLISSMEMKMNTTIRNINTTINKCYNNFKINIDKYSHKILFKSFYIDTFPNSLDINVKNINGENYYLLVLYNTNVILNTNDTVIISNSTNVTFKNSENEFLSIDSKYINKSHSFYSSDNKNYIYEIILGKISAVKTYKIDFNLKGGGHFHGPGRTGQRQCAGSRRAGARPDGYAEEEISRGHELRHPLRHHAFRADLDARHVAQLDAGAVGVGAQHDAGGVKEGGGLAGCGEEGLQERGAG